MMDETESLSDDLRETDVHMRAVLTPLAPPADFEARLIRRLLADLSPRHLLLRRATMTLAASLVIAATGYLGTHLSLTGRFPVTASDLSWHGGEGFERYDAMSLEADGLRDELSRANRAPRRRALAAAAPPPYRPEALGYLAGERGATPLADDKDFPTKAKRSFEYSFQNPFPATARPATPGLVAGKAVDANDSVLLPKDDESDNKAAPIQLGVRDAAGFGVSRKVEEQSPSAASSEVLIGRARTLIHGTNYPEALTVIDQLLAVDPKNEFAAAVRPLVEDRATIQSQRRYAGDKVQTLEHPIGGRPNTGLSDEDLLRVPENWPDISEVKPNGQAAVVEVPFDRKIIRTGTLSLEVDSFDVAAGKITGFVDGAHGFIASSNSQKLPNGKVQGTVVLRVPPEQLEGVLVLLRGVGDVRAQNVESADVTRHFTDTEGQLRAARAVEARLLDIIKNGKGEVKDLVAAETQLGEWRTKIETMEGELRYLSNQVSYSTLTVSLAERDLRAAATAVQTATVTAGVEVADVAKARGALVEWIAAVNGRVVESESRQLDGAGALAGATVAHVVADVPPGADGDLQARVRALGEVSKFDVERKEALQGDATGAAPKVERRMTRVTIDLFSPDAMTPKLTQSAEVAVGDVRKTYEDLLARALLTKVVGGRVLTSVINQPAGGDVAEVEATLTVVLPTTQGESLIAGLPEMGQVIRLQNDEAAASPNVTQAKRVVSLHLVPATRIAPRERETLSIQTTDLRESADKLLAAARAAGGHITECSGSTGPSGGTQRLTVELPSEAARLLLAEMRGSGKVLDESTALDANAPQGVFARTRIDLTLTAPPRLVADDEGVGASLRRAATTSVQGLLWSLRLLVIGICLLIPWVALVWVGRRVWSLRWRSAKNEH